MNTERMSGRKQVMFALAAIALASFGMVTALVAADLYLHRKYLDLIGLNVWGYRGPALGDKKPNEWRLAVLGGSTTFGYGVHWTQAIPAYLEAQLRGATLRPISVLNLGYNNEGAHSYRFTLEDYKYLGYDAVLLYSGYNDLSVNTFVFRHDSVLFRMTGYLPLLPTIAQEKAMAIRYNGRLEDAYRNEKTTFQPNLAQRTSASALEAVSNISQMLDAQFSSGASDARLGVEDGAAELGRECGERNAHYCGEMYLAIKNILDRGMPVFVVSQPYITERHVEQERVLQAFLGRRFGTNPKLRRVDLTRLIDLRDRLLCYDGMHLTPPGNKLVAAALAPHLRPLLEAAQ